MLSGSAPPALLVDKQSGGFRLNGPRRLVIELEGDRRTVTVGTNLPAASAHRPAEAGTPAELESASLDWAPDPAGGVVLDVDGRALRATLAPPPTVDSAIRAAHHGAGAAAAITAPMPGVVIGVRVREGDAVEAHQVLLVLEAMKMENAVSAPVDGVVDRVLVRPGQAVQRGDVLIELVG